MEPLGTHSVEFVGTHCAASLVWEDEWRVAKGHLLGYLADHEHRTVWVVDTEGAALLENWIVPPCHLTVPALAVTEVLAVVHRSAAMPMPAVKVFLAWL